ncbi:AAA-ATPase At2g46620-like [Cynara cardunculus var. scolymus]|uniref:AAA+ ATPase domain-containing protein n=1 Tax=Cynara cardunculus var. scolymus TaxID=59895 RepID=A0A118JT19_CYNCS|nr:AAA-ATPase At2g46620-like [Cynara cardunculus var. scolymus]KVH89021.1 AAA+ ATPase domain-containing protein [Cynara cardunculus var. scolymus]
MGFFLFLFLIISFLISVRLFFYRTTLIYRLKKWGHWIEDRIHVHQSLKVPQLNENNQENLFYRKVSTYLNSLSTIEDSDFTNLIYGKKPNGVVLCLDDDQTILDTFLGARVSWTNRVERIEENGLCKKTFLLKLKKKDKRRILQSYIQHIYRASEDIDSRCKELKLYMNTATLSDDHGSIGRWRSVRLTHPATLETIAMDSDLKKKVKSDLEAFLKSRQYYHRLGRVWKRSYLLYGPSGTGKSSFIAAMAKFLSYDVYDIDLSKVVDDSDLKMLLLQTSSKSLVVVEDLDRFITSNSTTVSLSGILNFMDGILNSCCGDEKLMVFTMNSKEKMDPAVLRPGRIDVHIYFPLCNFNSFKTLANNCLGVKDHKLFPQVEEIFQTGATMSPAEMSELMICNRGSPGRALRSVMTALQINGDGRKSVLAAEESSSSVAETSSVLVMDSSCSVPVVKEIQKLYGLLKMKSSKKIGPSDQFSGSMDRR